MIIDQKKARIHAESHPYHYGVILGMNVFHVIHEDHDGLPGIHIKDPDDKSFEKAVEKAIEKGEPAIIIHGYHPPMLWDAAPPAEHPHAYDLHDGGELLGKSEEFLSAARGTPKPTIVAERHNGDTQYAGKNPATYRPIAEQYGSILPDRHLNLRFYHGLEDHERRNRQVNRRKWISDHFYWREAR